MPRYYFNVEDGQSIPDPDGTDLPDLDSARREAVRLAGRLLEDHPSEFWRRGVWRLVVTDDAGVALFSLALIAREANQMVAANE